MGNFFNSELKKRKNETAEEHVERLQRIHKMNEDKKIYECLDALWHEFLLGLTEGFTGTSIENAKITKKLFDDWLQLKHPDYVGLVEIGKKNNHPTIYLLNKKEEEEGVPNK